MFNGNKKKILILALYAGEIILKNGGETYRVEDTIIRLCKSRGLSYVESFVTPTGIFVSVDNKSEDENEMISFIKRIKSRKIDLSKVAKVNDFSRRFVESDMSTDEAMKLLKIIDITPPYPSYIKAGFGGLASAFFSLMLGANALEFFSAFITSIFVTYTLKALIDVDFPPFLTHISGGAVAVIMAIIFSSFHPSINMDLIIIGAIMVMVPGVAITNAVRDSIAGDLISGLARAGEALIVATSIAFGVGFVLKIWTFISGGTLI
ncbi:MAG: threonine/serine exporter family protein [Clostridiaceae bacterium]|nr:threonine/serine exporter family protein [Clostridiaceae bacterium]